MTSSNSTEPPSTGFVLVEQVLHEFRDTGKSPTLEKFKAQVKAGLGRMSDPSPRVAKEAAAVQAAMDLAVEMIEAMRAEARKPKRAAAKA